MPPTAEHPSETVDIFVNDGQRTIAAGTALSALLDAMAISSRPGVAVAVNASVVPRSEWQARALRQGDRILVIHASQGG